MAKDVAKALGYIDPAQAIRDNCKKVNKITQQVSTTDRVHIPPITFLIISESGLYALVFRSHKPEARAFSKWVRGDVLPTYRQNGFVGTPPQSRVGPCRA